MTKRRFSVLSDEMQPVAKRSRHCTPSSAFPTEEDLDFLAFNSSSEHGDDIAESIYTTMNDSCHSLDNTIPISSDDDEASDISSPVSFIIDTFISPVNDVEEALDIENDEEIIDLTVDESNCTYYSLDRLEQQICVDSEECPICLESFSDLQYTGVYLMITQCNHVMCILCSQQLLASSPQCPLCRESVSLDTLMPYCILT